MTIEKNIKDKYMSNELKKTKSTETIYSGRIIMNYDDPFGIRSITMDGDEPSLRDEWNYIRRRNKG